MSTLSAAAPSVAGAAAPSAGTADIKPFASQRLVKRPSDEFESKTVRPWALLCVHTPEQSLTRAPL